MGKSCDWCPVAPTLLNKSFRQFQPCRQLGQTARNDRHRVAMVRGERLAPHRHNSWGQIGDSVDHSTSIRLECKRYELSVVESIQERTCNAFPTRVQRNQNPSKLASNPSSPACPFVNGDASCPARRQSKLAKASSGKGHSPNSGLRRLRRIEPTTWENCCVRGWHG